MEEDIRFLIEWDRRYNSTAGKMEIIADKFFPAASPRLKRLLKTIDKDWEHRERLLTEMAEYCEREAEDHDRRKKGLANTAVDARTEASEMKPDMERQEAAVLRLKEYVKGIRGKSPYKEQLKKLQEEYKAAKKKHRKLMARFRYCSAEFNRADASAKKLQQNAGMIRAWM